MYRNATGTSVDELHYRRTGSGEPLLLIHGLGADHRLWDLAMPYLSEVDVIAVDLPGHAPRAQQRDELPTDAVWTPLRDCGHAPMLDDPGQVAEAIRQTIGRAAS